MSFDLIVDILIFLKVLLSSTCALKLPYRSDHSIILLLEIGMTSLQFIHVVSFTFLAIIQPSCLKII